MGHPNVSQTETKSRKEGETDWQSKITKTDYDAQGNATREYPQKGVKEGVSSKYTYDIWFLMVKGWKLVVSGSEKVEMTIDLAQEVKILNCRNL